jgi:hypothetical protein
MRKRLVVFEYRKRQITVRTTRKHLGMQAEHAMRMLKKCAYSDVSEMHHQDPVGVQISQNQENLSAFSACSIAAALPAWFLLLQPKK